MHAKKEGGEKAMTICDSCLHSRVMRRNGRQFMLCTYELGAKVHRPYCPDYINREGFIWKYKNRQKRERYNESGYMALSL